MASKCKLNMRGDEIDTPWTHQTEGSTQVVKNKHFGLFDEMGVGKSKTLMDGFYSLREEGQLQGGLVVCPNQVKGQWTDLETGQLVKNTAANFPISITRIDSSKSPRHWTIYEPDVQPSFHWFVTNYEALRVKSVVTFLSNFMRHHMTGMALDESIFIKNHRALRSKACFELGKLASRRYAMNGTPLTKGLEDYFAQFWFLNPNIIGVKNAIVFRNRYCVMGGYMVNNRPVQIVGYQNVPELLDKIKPFYRRVTKAECLDLPDKLYQTVEIQMTKQQDEYYKNMKANFLVQVKDKTITAKIALTKLLRLRQICSSFITDSGRESIIEYFDECPKVEYIIEQIALSELPVVVFCNFIPEIEMLKHALIKEEVSFGEIYGDIKTPVRDAYIKQFQNNDLKVMVCQIATGGIGIELSKAGLVIYISNPESFYQRQQSEDRVHRSGLKHNVTYIDVLATRQNGAKTVDHGIRADFLKMKNFATKVVDTEVEDWDEKI